MKTAGNKTRTARGPEDLREKICYHCGDLCTDDTTFFDEKVFCCTGCKMVYEILNENQLCSYYQFQQGAGNSPEKNLFSGKFDYLDRPEVSRKLLHFSDDNQSHITFFIPGIHCSSCIYLLENLEKLEAGVIASSVNFPRREVTIVFHPQQGKLSSIAERLAQIGYEPHIRLDQLNDKRQAKKDRSQWYKIGIAGFCFGNIMMMSFPEYFSIGDYVENAGLQRLFTWLNLGLSLPVLLYSSQDFFRSAWAALRTRHLNIDLPIAAAILMTFLRSVYELISNTGPGYFDSMTGIVFFMLIGRVFQNRTYATLSFDRDYKSYFPIAVTLIEPASEIQIPVTQLRKGMRIRVRNQELIPADSILLRGEALIDYSFVTGESEPVGKSAGELIYAGGRQTGTAIELEVINPVRQSYLTQLWNNPAFSKDSSEAERASFVNAINQNFTLGVFLLAAGAATYWGLQGDTTRMMNAVTTILIVACPCILLLASTFTNGAILRALGKNKLYLKNAAVIEKLAQADTLVFDKTGTITLTREMLVSAESMPLSIDQCAAVYSLARQSSHPLSVNIAAIYKGMPRLQVDYFSEFPGRGIEGKVNQQWIRLGSAEFLGLPARRESRRGAEVYLEIEGRIMGHYQLRHVFRENLAGLLPELQKDHKLYLLSGDNDAGRGHLSAYFEDRNMHFNCTPQQKLDFIRQLQAEGRKVIMIGDGLNDAGALQQSDAGIAVSDSNSHFSPACDAILDGEALSRLAVFIRYCKDQRRIIGTAFAFSLLYNVIGLWFALRGELQPVIAAILMPSASISIVCMVTLSAAILAYKKGL